MVGWVEHWRFFLGRSVWHGDFREAEKNKTESNHVLTSFAPHSMPEERLTHSAL